MHYQWLNELGQLLNAVVAVAQHAEDSLSIGMHKTFLGYAEEAYFPRQKGARALFVGAHPKTQPFLSTQRTAALVAPKPTLAAFF